MEHALLKENEGGFLDVENDIKVSMIDIPDFHCFQEKIGDDFFAALAEV